MTIARIVRIRLRNFRSYRSAEITAGAGPVVLFGANGAGKTNLLEAISLFAPGRGLRRAPLEELAFVEGDGSWAVSMDVHGALGLASLGTGVSLSTSEGGTTPVREYRVDRESVPSAAAFTDHLRVVWLVPAMDRLFNGPASERRRFLDRLVLAVDPKHGSRFAALERALRSRNRLLEVSRPDAQWLDAMEHETAELAVAVAALRLETVDRLKGALKSRRARNSPFPAADIRLDGTVETFLQEDSALTAEDRYRTLLRDNRSRDAAAGRTLEGPHLTDLCVSYVEKQVAAADASTGEQKALLIGLVLAHAQLVAEMSGTTPVLLLDEVVAHLDPQRRAALYNEIEGFGAQVWMTGADPALFKAVAGDAELFEVSSGRFERRN
jgi:DNA replication and repair protein RecF